MRRLLCLVLALFTCAAILTGCSDSAFGRTGIFEAPTSKFPDEPPILAVSDGESTVYAWRGTTSWTVKKLDGTGTGIQSDSPHPLDCVGDIPALEISKDASLTLTFEAAPDRILVRKYSKSADYDSYEELEINGTLEVEEGNYLYEVIATWDTSLKSYSGKVYYAFCTVRG